MWFELLVIFFIALLYIFHAALGFHIIKEKQREDEGYDAIVMLLPVLGIIVAMCLDSHAPPEERPDYPAGLEIPEPEPLGKLPPPLTIEPPEATPPPIPQYELQPPPLSQVQEILASLDAREAAEDQLEASPQPAEATPDQPPQPAEATPTLDPKATFLSTMRRLNHARTTAHRNLH